MQQTVCDICKSVILTKPVLESSIKIVHNKEEYNDVCKHCCRRIAELIHDLKHPVTAVCIACGR